MGFFTCFSLGWSNRVDSTPCTAYHAHIRLVSFPFPHLHDADLRPKSEREQHEEEEAGPDGRPGDLCEDVCHNDEGKACPLGRLVQLSRERTVPQAGVCVVPGL
jgi:hypothetical protein